jgi:hypothetical protein
VNVESEVHIDVTPIGRHELVDAYERGMSRLAQINATRRWLKARLRDCQEEEKALKAKLRPLARELFGFRKGHIHFHFDGEAAPESSAIDVEATVV